MAKLVLPPGVRYECIRCGRCCRSLEVTLTEAERAALTKYDWAAEWPSLTPDALFARIRRPRGKQAWRLRPLPSGACRFLTPEGLCLVHATLGVAAKPFAGRLFPFTFLRTPVGVFVGARFNCPAVVRGLGPPVQVQQRALEELYDEYASTYEPPSAGERVRFFGRYELAWADILRVEEQMVEFLREREFDLPRRVLACRRLVRRLVGEAVRSRESGRVAAEPGAILGALRHGVYEIKPPSRIERMMLRLLVATFLGARLPSFRELSVLGRTRERARNVLLRGRMAAGRGRLRLPETEAAVPIRAVRAPDSGVLDADSDEMLERYLVAKVASQGFFGLSFFRRSFAEGLDALIAAYGVIVWLAAAHALAAGRKEPTAEDVEYGIRHVDYGFNYLGQFGGTVDRLRAVLFWQWETPEKLLAALAENWK
jgi:Fe-S-cluster containining protein